VKKLKFPPVHTRFSWVGPISTIGWCLWGIGKHKWSKWYSKGDKQYRYCENCEKQEIKPIGREHLENER
jgi:hypothetical protein